MADTTLLSGTHEPDLKITLDDLTIDDGLATAILISLFSDERADGERGWWADDAQPGWGSKLWQLERETRRESLLPLVEAAAEAALAWLVQDGVLVSVSVRAYFGDAGELVIVVSCRNKLGRPRV